MNKLFLLLLFLFSALVQAQNATEIVRKAEEKFRGTQSAYTEMTIKIIRKKWDREMSMKSWAKGTDYSLILLTDPAKDKGTAFLKRHKEVWNWVPSIERTIKLPPSMMGQSWMGTDFSNDDLVRESSSIRDYNHEIIGDSTLQGLDCYKINLIPKEEAAVVWGKVVLYIAKKEFIQLRAEQYDEDGYLVNIMNSSEVKEMDGRLLAAKSEVIPVEKKGQKTVMTINKIAFDKPMEESFFTTQNMKKVK